MSPTSLSTPAPTEVIDIAIIGSGFAGLAMAIRLQQAGLTDFRIYERADELGGTWRDNQYPGAACDVQSHLYSLSFEPNPLWSRMFATANEIQDYVLHCVRTYDLRRRTRTGTEIVRAAYDSERGRWRLEAADGLVIDARTVVSGTGGLSQPGMPDIPGIDRFNGPLFHSAQWDHSVDLKGKRVAVVGTGASSIQIVPAIAPEVQKLTVFQRSPAWVIPKPDRTISATEQSLYARFPLLQKLQRTRLYATLDPRSIAFNHLPALMKPMELRAKLHIRSAVKNKARAAALTPSYHIGCKRVLMSNDYYPAMARSNVDLQTGKDGAIREIVANGVVTADGRLHEVDCIVMATGFQSADALAPFDIRGKDGRSLADVWGINAEAYKGTTVHGFPNLYILVGPNTGLGHSSMILMIEAQVNYAVQAIQLLKARGLRSLEVKKDAQQRYNEHIHVRLQRSVWSTGCGAWYTNSEGRNTTLWPGSTTEFIQRMRTFDSSAYHAVPRVEWQQDAPESQPARKRVRVESAAHAAAE